MAPVFLITAVVLITGYLYIDDVEHKENSIVVALGKLLRGSQVVVNTERDD